MKTSGTARFSLSEEQIEIFISELWVELERWQIPTPRLRLFAAGSGRTTLELSFDRQIGRGDPKHGRPGEPARDALTVTRITSAVHNPGYKALQQV